MGFSDFQRGYLIWVPGKSQYLVSRTCQFFEHIVYKNDDDKPKALRTRQAPHPASTAAPDGDTILPQPVNNESAPVTQTQPVTHFPKTPPKQCSTPGCTLTKGHLGNCGAPTVNHGDLPSAAVIARRPHRANIADVGVEVAQWNSEAGNENPDELMIALMTMEDDHDGIQAMNARVKQFTTADGDQINISVPHGYEQAVKSPDAKRYKIAMDEEMSSIRENNVEK